MFEHSSTLFIYRVNSVRIEPRRRTLSGPVDVVMVNAEESVLCCYGHGVRAAENQPADESVNGYGNINAENCLC